MSEKSSSLAGVSSLIIALSIASAVHAASFNCARARAADERTVCADRVLNDQDVRVGLLFDITRGLVPMGRRGQIQDEQIEWLKGRRQCGSNRVCLMSTYSHRIGRLMDVIRDVESRGPY